MADRQGERQAPLLPGGEGMVLNLPLLRQAEPVQETIIGVNPVVALNRRSAGRPIYPGSAPVCS